MKFLTVLAFLLLAIHSSHCVEEQSVNSRVRNSPAFVDASERNSSDEELTLEDHATKLADQYCQQYERNRQHDYWTDIISTLSVNSSLQKMGVLFNLALTLEPDPLKHIEFHVLISILREASHNNEEDEFSAKLKFVTGKLPQFNMGLMAKHLFTIDHQDQCCAIPAVLIHKWFHINKHITQQDAENILQYIAQLHRETPRILNNLYAICKKLEVIDILKILKDASLLDKDLREKIIEAYVLFFTDSEDGTQFTIDEGKGLLEFFILAKHFLAIDTAYEDIKYKNFADICHKIHTKHLSISLTLKKLEEIISQGISDYWEAVQYLNKDAEKNNAANSSDYFADDDFNPTEAEEESEEES